MAAMAPRPEASHKARRLMNIAAAARGREPLAFEIEVIPFFAGELPSGIDRVSFVWERGSKIFATDAEQVNPHTNAAFWRQFLKQTATLYRDAGGQLLPKEYTFKVQHVRSGGTGGDGVRRTVGKAKLDLSRFCSGEDAPALPQELFLQLKPAGKLKVSIKSTWLKDAPVDMDALTEASFGTHRSGMEGGDFEEQDLSGFDPGAAEQGEVGVSRQQQALPRGTSPASARGHGQDRAGSHLRPGGGAPGAIARAQGSPRIQAAVAHRKVEGAASGTLPPGVIPPFCMGLSPDEERAALEQEKARQAAFQAAEIENMRRTIEERLRSELHEALAKHQGRGWRSLFCCCWPRHQQARPAAAQELAAAPRLDQAEDTLLSAARGALL